MEIFILIAGFLFLVAGLVGCVLPMVPGPPLAYVGMLVLQLSDRVHFSVTTLVVSLILVVISLVIDYVAPLIGTKMYGGSRWGNWGCIAGTVLGIFIFPPWGFIIGPLGGAIIGELMYGKKGNEAVLAGLGAFIGFFSGLILKLLICGFLIYKSIVACF